MQQGRLTFGRRTPSLSSLSIGTGAFVELAPGGGNTLRTRALTLNAAAVGLDVADNGGVIDYAGTSPLPSVAAAVARGYDGGTWRGEGIASSTAATAPGHGVGYAEASAVFTSFPAAFAGEVVDATSVLLRYVRYGDANLDGRVDLQDFNRLAAAFGSTNAVWTQGDFNYDGNVNLRDFNLLAANFGLAAVGRRVTPHDWAALAPVVPEPSASWLMTLALNGLCRRRRRRGRQGRRPVTARG